MCAGNDPEHSVTPSLPPSAHPCFLSSTAGGAAEAPPGGVGWPAASSLESSPFLHGSPPTPTQPTQARPRHPGSRKFPAHTWARSQAPEFQVSFLFLQVISSQPVACQPASGKPSLAPSRSSSLPRDPLGPRTPTSPSLCPQPLPGPGCRGNLQAPGQGSLQGLGLSGPPRYTEESEIIDQGP